MKNIERLFLGVILILAVSVQAQDKILLLNGKSYEGKFLGNSPELVNFNFINKRGKVKPFSFESIRVYSFTKAGEPETVLYKRDTTIYHYYTPDQMRMFIYGEQDAYTRFKAYRPFISGFIAGFGISLYDTYLDENYVCDGVEYSGGFFKREPSLAQFVVPFVVPIVTGAIKPKMRARYASDTAFLTNEYYIEGFKKVRRFRRVKSALLGSLVGVAAGMLGYYISPKDC